MTPVAPGMCWIAITGSSVCTIFANFQARVLVRPAFSLIEAGSRGSAPIATSRSENAPRTERTTVRAWVGKGVWRASLLVSLTIKPVSGPCGGDRW